jgi:parvulin-like peptidyl-prolyl isomerase
VKLKALPITLVAALALSACATTFSAGAAVVNGVSIGQAELAARVDGKLSAQGGGIEGQPAPTGEQRLQTEREELVQLIREELVRQEIARRGITPDQTAIDAQLEQIKQGATDEEFAARVKQAGLTLEALVEQIRLSVAIGTIREDLTPPVEADQVRGVYDISLDQFKQVKVRHILFNVAAGSSEKKAKRKANATLVQLKSGADFGRLAKKYSDDTGTGANGGRLPGWTDISQFDQSFAAAADAAKIGKVTEPVRSQFGYHLILVDARRVQPFGAVKAQIRAQLEEQASQTAFQDLLSTLARDGDVVVNPRLGDWDPESGSIVPHTFFEAPEPETNPLPDPGLQLPPVAPPGG